MDDWTAGDVLRTSVGGVLIVTLNRPAHGNAWSAEIEDGYFTTLNEASADPEVRAIVLTGAGHSFCVGADVTEIHPGSSTIPVRNMTLPLAVPKPIIAAINGGCAGIGLVQALMSDIRFSAPTAKLTTAFVRRGLVAEHGISWILPRLVGPARAADLLLSGRVVTGDEAAAMGLVNAVSDDPLDAAVGYARELAVWSSPTSMAVIKQQIYRHLDVGIDEALHESDRLTTQSLTGEDLKEGISSFLQKRKPRFPPLASTSRDLDQSPEVVSER